ncbi:MAG: hypothetical protein A3G24_19585 [Betaproteobacteria bacterium RIFCSPLOWO2_12_FULL_62_13]|nr:MAG: hypothetical protein A3G24_19585 [Betaproteobacteria bacterium RIFCSPLOWO2_12_FULL_62_13]
MVRRIKRSPEICHPFLASCEQFSRGVFRSECAWWVVQQQEHQPTDLQSAQLSVPFSLAMALSLGRTRGTRAGMRREDYETALATPEVRALSSRVRCVVDPEIEAMTNTEEEPSRVTVKLADRHELVAKVDHPRGSPHRRMTWTELRELFRDTLADTLPEGAMQTVQARPVSICIKGFPS